MHNKRTGVEYNRPVSRRYRRRRSARRRSPAGNPGKNFKPLASLLDAQPKGLTRIPRHRLLWDHFMASEKLQKLRISPKCYRLLDQAKIRPDDLQEFYRTYRLPEDPFFPLFLAVKAEWFAGRERWKEEREAAILEMVKTLPEHRRWAMRILAEYEAGHHPAGDHPLWENRLFPRTKKRAAELLAFDEKDWYRLWHAHLMALSIRYRGIRAPGEDDEGRPNYSAKLLASLVLRCRRVERREIAENFRTLSKEFHPDRGGDEEAFRNLKEARDMLLQGR